MTTACSIKNNQKAHDIRGRSLWKDARLRLQKNRAATISMIIMALIAALAILVPEFHRYSYDFVDWDNLSLPPTWSNGHYFGTDSNGRDLFVRCFYGARVSLVIGLAASAVALVIGVTYGAVAGFVGGKVDNIMMRFVDVIYSLPFMFLLIVLMVFFGPSMFLIFVALGAVEWLDMARIVRGQAMSIKRKEFIEAAHAMGVRPGKIIQNHIIPNCVGPVIVYVSLLVPRVILAESFLSFLGLGISEPQTSWGKLINDGAASMEVAPWLLIFPAAFLAITLFCLNFIGDGLRDALDPKDR